MLTPAQKKAASIARKQRTLQASGTKQFIPSNIGAKSRPLSRPTLPVVRRSVVG